MFHATHGEFKSCVNIYALWIAVFWTECNLWNMLNTLDSGVLQKCVTPHDVNVWLLNLHLFCCTWKLGKWKCTRPLRKRRMKFIFIFLINYFYMRGSRWNVAGKFVNILTECFKNFNQDKLDVYNTSLTTMCLHKSQVKPVSASVAMNESNKSKEKCVQRQTEGTFLAAIILLTIQQGVTIYQLGRKNFQRRLSEEFTFNKFNSIAIYGPALLTSYNEEFRFAFYRRIGQTENKFKVIRRNRNHPSNLLKRNENSNLQVLCLPKEDTWRNF